MCDVCRVPDHHILVVDWFAIDPVVEARFVGRPYGNHAIVNFCPVVAENPNIATREIPIWGSRRHAVVRPGDHLIPLTRHCILDPPFSFACGIAKAPDFESLGMPVRRAKAGSAWVVIFAYDVVPSCPNVKIEPPVDVMMMSRADTRTLHG